MVYVGRGSKTDFTSSMYGWLLVSFFPLPYVVRLNHYGSIHRPLDPNICSTVSSRLSPRVRLGNWATNLDPNAHNGINHQHLLDGIVPQPITEAILVSE